MNSAAKKPSSVLIVGPYGAGKKTILYTAKHGQSAEIMPLIGVDFEKLTINETPLMIWSIGGRSAYRPLLVQHYKRMSAFIFVLDSSDHERIDNTREQLHHLTKDENFGGKPILIFANKQDLPNTMDSEQIRDKLELEKLNKNIKWHIQPASATKNQGLQQGLEWLMNAIQEKNDLTKPIVETFNDTIVMKNDFFSKFNLAQIKVIARKFFSVSFSSIQSVIKLVDI